MTLVAAAPASAWLYAYDDEAEWLADVANVRSIEFTAGNLVQANEISAPPSVDDDLGSTLTFPTTSSGVSFRVRTLQAGKGFVFEEGPGSGPLSVGRTDAMATANDDFEVDQIGGSYTAFAFDLYGNEEFFADGMRVYDTSGGLIGELGGSSISASSGTAFMGFVSDALIGRIVFDSQAPNPIGQDNVGIGRFQFAGALVTPTLDFQMEVGDVVLKTNVPAEVIHVATDGTRHVLSDGSQAIASTLQNLAGMEVLPGGDVLLAVRGTYPRVVRVDARTGEQELVVDGPNLAPGLINDIEMDPFGNVFALAHHIHELDVVTGSTTQLTPGVLSTAFLDVGDLAFDPATGSIFALGDALENLGDLYTVDRSDGSWSLVANFSSGSTFVDHLVIDPPTGAIFSGRSGSLAASVLEYFPGGNPAVEVTPLDQGGNFSAAGTDEIDPLNGDLVFRGEFPLRRFYRVDPQAATVVEMFPSEPVFVEAFAFVREPTPIVTLPEPAAGRGVIAGWLVLSILSRRRAAARDTYSRRSGCSSA